MQITVIDVSENTKKSESGRTFQQLEIAYKNEQGTPQLKKLISFSNPNMYKLAKTWVKGDTFNITTVKNAKGYWDWTGIEGEGQVATESKPAATPTRVTGSNYETKEERTARQLYIIRQSSLANAIEILNKGADTAEVLKLADKLVNYVLAKTEGIEAINEQPDDIPE